MTAPTAAQMAEACEQAARHLDPTYRPHDAASDRSVHVEVFSTPHLAPGISLPGDWYEVGILYVASPRNALGVYLDPTTGDVKVERPLDDVISTPPPE